MRIIVIGQKLEKHLFEIIKYTQNFSKDLLFYKSETAIDVFPSDIIIVESSFVNILANDIKNLIITIVTNTRYKKKFINEEITSLLAIKDIAVFIAQYIKQYITEQKYIAVDPKTVSIFNLAHKIAKTDASVFITGATGTGKEVIAKYIHDHSFRSKRSFVAINCAAIPEGILESEMFGHEKGAFTNAIERRIGKFEEANHGTIFLDEISEMPILLQSKLLRVLQEKTINRLGGTGQINVDTRVIASSNINISDAIKNNCFREDLFYRLNVINIHLPNLSKRKLDIVPLAIFFCNKYSNGTKVISESLLEQLQECEWHGNIRELQNVIQRAVILSNTDVITDLQTNFDPNPRQQTLKEIENNIIIKVFGDNQKNYQKTAKILGISERNLRYKIKQYPEKQQ